VFQQLDLPAQWRLSHVQSGSRAPEMQLLRDGDEAAELGKADH
jgi:hypothetical protein